MFDCEEYTVSFLFTCIGDLIISTFDLELYEASDCKRILFLPFLFGTKILVAVMETNYAWGVSHAYYSVQSFEFEWKTSSRRFLMRMKKKMSSRIEWSRKQTMMDLEEKERKKKKKSQ
ncbi:hypothetical protein K1719_038848 [Acacia pycnantha]|nr:hypothetical protein K1719_038848 [Acacia pycnantha]